MKNGFNELFWQIISTSRTSDELAKFLRGSCLPSEARWFFSDIDDDDGDDVDGDEDDDADDDYDDDKDDDDFEGGATMAW